MLQWFKNHASLCMLWFTVLTVFFKVFKCIFLSNSTFPWWTPLHYLINVSFMPPSILWYWWKDILVKNTLNKQWIQMILIRNTKKRLTNLKQWLMFSIINIDQKTFSPAVKWVPQCVKSNQLNLGIILWNDQKCTFKLLSRWVRYLLQKHTNNMKHIRDSLWGCHPFRFKVNHAAYDSRDF